MREATRVANEGYEKDRVRAGKGGRGGEGGGDEENIGMNRQNVMMSQSTPDLGGLESEYNDGGEEGGGGGGTKFPPL